MSAKTRASSPPSTAPKDAAKEEEKPPPTSSQVSEGAANFGSAQAPPSRPQGLRSKMMKLYGVLAAVLLIFAIIGESMVHSVPEGKFELRNGTLIDISAYDPIEYGPYPKCHPHHNEYEESPGVWKKNKEAPTGGPYPVGHPENPDWVKLADERTKKENAENRFRWKGLQPNLHLLLLATLCVYIGSLNGVWEFTRTVGDDNANDSAQGQVLQSGDAAMFPVMGSVVLLGLFVIIKYLGNDAVKMLITSWVVLICTFGLGNNLDWIVALIREKKMAMLFRMPLMDDPITPIWIVGACIGAGMSVAYLLYKHWIVNNIFGVSFCLLGLRMIGLHNFKVGAIMLIGLFFYDVFWVFGSKSIFGSNVMVSVATGIEAPIKLMFPRDLGGCGILRHSMLGLGDIVVPGIFIAFLAKWDASLISSQKAQSFVYLNVVMISYFLSLVTTVGVMLFFNAAQPALLYIVPYILITALIVACVRGEVKALCAFEISDEAASKPEEKTTGEDKKGK